MGGKRTLNSYIRTVIAPVIFHGETHERSDNIYGQCPNCGTSANSDSERCSITIIDDCIVGGCFYCGWTVRKFREDHPEYESLFSGYTKYLEENAGSKYGTLEREHIYKNSLGKILYRKQIYRKPRGGKDARWQTMEPDGMTYSNSIPKGQHAPIYRLDEITATSKKPDLWIFLTEGEKDADNLVELMKSPATCLPNGAVRATTKLFPDWISPFNGRKVVIIGDNDEQGYTSAAVLTDKLIPIAAVVKKIMPTDLLDLSFEDIAAKKHGYDVSDYIEEVGKMAAYEKIKSLVDRLPVCHASENQDAAPGWIIDKPSSFGINEPLFCSEFRKKYNVARVNSVYYIDGESKTDDYIQQLVQSEIQNYFVERTGQIAKRVMMTLDNTCYCVQPDPDDRKIYCAGSISLILGRDGKCSPYEEETFSLTRLPVKYTPGADCPVFEEYLKELFHEEDIPAIQEFIGYCLIPCTRAQACLFIKGNGGEGKSVLTAVLTHLFGHAAIQEAVHQLGDRFVLANLENKLICIDDDLKTDLLADTSWIKKIATAQGKLEVERKQKQKYNASIYARILGIGNTFIGSKFDQSDGFYRRQLLIDCLPKTRSRKDDDPYMADKCIAELAGILNWALLGLQRLVQNNYRFTVSARMQQTLDDVKRDADPTISFFSDSSYVTVADDWSLEAKSADLFRAYALYCKDNGVTPMKQTTFNKRIGSRFHEKKRRIEGVQGYGGIEIRAEIMRRIRAISAESAWLDRLT